MLQAPAPLLTGGNHRGETTAGHEVTPRRSDSVPAARAAALYRLINRGPQRE